MSTNDHPKMKITDLPLFVRIILAIVTFVVVSSFLSGQFGSRSSTPVQQQQRLQMTMTVRPCNPYNAYGENDTHLC
jgi:hypothetical protein